MCLCLRFDDNDMSAFEHQKFAENKSLIELTNYNT